ncbi:MAG: tRNA pseudouridine(38-40) synthase TruA [Cyanobacteria bacterium SIG30]|nr:tRNA pseudouridine(38-40) synthase TruA [Cyanobacteria bacterium SIG30]
MPRYKLTLQYLGQAFKGSQKQKDARTVQDELEKAISTLTQQKISTIFSGRTDAGVNALGQVVHFDYEGEIKLYNLNCILPKEIKVTKLTKTNKKFHAQMSAKSRHYQYKIRNSEVENVFDTDTLYYRHKLDLKRINESLSYIVGEHDFSAFKSSSDNPAKICKIYKAKATKSKDVIKIDIIGNRFLYNMVRTIIGTLLMIEKDNLPPAKMKEILKSKEREMAGPVISPIGLTLMKVEYTNKYEKGKINENI